MGEREGPRITELLNRAKGGNLDAEAELAPLIYQELRRLARRYMRGERPNHTLETTGLVHEAYLRLMGSDQSAWLDRNHFFAVAAGVMRRILVDYARARKAVKRGGLFQFEARSSIEAGSRESWDKILDVHDALTRLAEFDPRQARVVELRFFSGLEIAEVAEVLGVSTRTVKRDWEFAQAWLYAQIASSYETGKSSVKMSPARSKLR